MRKEWIICIIVILLVVLANIMTQNYTKKSVEFIDAELETLKEALGKQEVEKEKVEQKMEEIMNEWRERYEKLAFFIEHDELEKVETELTSLKAHIHVEQYEEGVPELEKSIFILNHIKEKFRLNVKNIF